MIMSRTLGIMIDHQAVDLLLTKMSDTIRNEAYHVANERYPVGSKDRSKFFDENNTLIGYDELSNKALLKDSLDHYIQFCTASGHVGVNDFNYYLQDSFELVAERINSDYQKLNYLTSLFAEACGILASSLSPVVEDISSVGLMVEKIESFAMRDGQSYYVVHGTDIDNAETYDPKEDDLSTVDVSETEEELQRKLKDRVEKDNKEALGEIVNELITKHPDILRPDGSIDIFGMAAKAKRLADGVELKPIPFDVPGPTEMVYPDYVGTLAKLPVEPVKIYDFGNTSYHFTQLQTFAESIDTIKPADLGLL